MKVQTNHKTGIFMSWSVFNIYRSRFIDTRLLIFYSKPPLPSPQIHCPLPRTCPSSLFEELFQWGRDHSAFWETWFAGYQFSIWKQEYTDQIKPIFLCIFYAVTSLQSDLCLLVLCTNGLVFRYKKRKKANYG